MNIMTQGAGGLASPFKTRYDNFIGGKFVPPVNGKYMDNVTPITGAVVCQVARSDAADMNLALDAAHAAFGGYKQSGIGRETHKMMLDHYRQT
jgi:aldehyde dehydrogenase